jgi:hypothetical protein
MLLIDNTTILDRCVLSHRAIIVFIPTLTLSHHQIIFHLFHMDFKPCRPLHIQILLAFITSGNIFHPVEAAAQRKALNVVLQACKKSETPRSLLNYGNPGYCNAMSCKVVRYLFGRACLENRRIRVCSNGLKLEFGPCLTNATE